LNWKYLLLGLAAIVAGSILFEHYAELLYPMVDLGPIDVRGVALGEPQSFHFFKDGTQVGNYTYSVVDSDPQTGTYRAMHRTKVNYEGTSILLEGLYRFDASYRPLEYALNATTGTATESIQCSFTPGLATITLTGGGGTNVLTQEIPEDALLVENSMPGYWEMLFQSATFERGKRYSASVFVPQAGGVKSLSLVVEKDLRQFRVGDQLLDCTIIKESNLGLTFYIHGGELIQYQDEAQEVLLRKTA
jgi:hypothetical protein